MTKNAMDINTSWVTSINCPLPGGVSLTTFSKAFLSDHLDGYFTAFLNGTYGVPADVAGYIAPQFRNAIMAHFAGDETIWPEEQAADDWVGNNVSPILGGALQNIWHDLPTADNTSHIDLK